MGWKIVYFTKIMSSAKNVGINSLDKKLENERTIKMNWTEKLKIFFGKIKDKMEKNKCYSQREREGVAAMGCCRGLAGGDRSTDYLQYSCVVCNHFVNTKR